MRLMDSQQTEIENQFLNSAYLSELWAVKDLQNIKLLHPKAWTTFRESQLQDEVSHASQLLNLLKLRNFKFTSDLNFAIQERLYKVDGKKSALETVQNRFLFHEMAEHRAKWIYKTFIKQSENAHLIKVVKGILEDEKNHFHLGVDQKKTSKFFQDWKKIDQEIFKKILPEKFGRLLYKNNLFWNWYFTA